MTEKTATVKSVQKFNKIAKATLTAADGRDWPVPVLYFLSAPFAADIEEGKQITVTVTKKQGDRGEETWFETVNGKGAQANRGGGGGGGGGRPYQPKSAAEIHASCIAGIIKSGIEFLDTPEQIAPYLELYWKSIARAG